MPSAAPWVGISRDRAGLPSRLPLSQLDPPLPLAPGRLRSFPASPVLLLKASVSLENRSPLSQAKAQWVCQSKPEPARDLSPSPTSQQCSLLDPLYMMVLDPWAWPHPREAQFSATCCWETSLLHKRNWEGEDWNLSRVSALLSSVCWISRMESKQAATQGKLLDAWKTWKHQGGTWLKGKYPSILLCEDAEPPFLSCKRLEESSRFPDSTPRKAQGCSQELPGNLNQNLLCIHRLYHSFLHFQVRLPHSLINIVLNAVGCPQRACCFCCPFCSLIPNLLKETSASSSRAWQATWPSDHNCRDQSGYLKKNWHESWPT